MSIIEPVPKLESLPINLDFLGKIYNNFQKPELQNLIQKANDKYYYWSDIRTQFPLHLDIKAEEVWAYLKLGRNANRKITPIKDKNDQFFTYWIPDTLHRKISEVDKWSGAQIITDQPFNLPSKEKYIISSLMNESIASSQLEGASTEYKVAKEMLRSGRKPNNKSEQMIFNNWKGMQYIRENIKMIFSIEQICELQSILTQDTLEHSAESGKFREGDDIAIYYKDELVFIPPGADTISKRMSGLCEFANKDDENKWIHPVIKGAMIHFWLAYTHPFTDGNGRTARALMYWYLLSRGYELFQYLSISKHFLRAPGQYVKAYLHTEHDDNDLTYFLNYNLSAIHFAINELRQYIEDKQREISTANQLLNNFRGLNQRQKSLIYHSLQHSETIYTIEAHKNTHGIGRETARKDLAALVSKGFLRMQREGKKLLLFSSTGKAMDKLRNK